MPQRIGLNLLNPQTNNNNIHFLQMNNNIQQPIQNTQFRGLSYNNNFGFNSMISRVVNSKPGCSSCGK